MPSSTHLNQIQFGDHAENFVRSQTHAQGYTLGRLVEVVQPQSSWRTLDIATGGGHTAIAFSRHVHEVIATDLTNRMLIAAKQNAEVQGASNIRYAQVDAHHLPFANQSFECITCRIAPHHFPDVGAFVNEATRLLKPDGILAIADNVVSGEARTARLVNNLERFRDPSHHWAYSLDDWETFFFSAGLTVSHTQIATKDTDVDEWASRLAMAGNDLIRLKALILNTPKPVTDWLKPRQIGSRLIFTVTEAVIVGRKAG